MIPSGCFTIDREKILKGDITLRELVKSYIVQIEKLNPDINAIISYDAEGALDLADYIQKKIEGGRAGKLAGALFAVKDNICEKGKKLTCASHILNNFESLIDAHVIEKIKQEDGILLARSNMDEFGMGSSTEYTIYGASRNPYNYEKICGGSSGGSAAAVAAKMVNLALGSDTGGSVRQPASFCGTIGLKPSYGRISRYGLVAFASSLDCIGVFGSTIQDISCVMEVIAGEDKRDSTTSSLEVSHYGSAIKRHNNRRWRIGLIEDFFNKNIHSDIKDRINQLTDILQEEGHILKRDLSLPHLDVGVSTYYIINMAEASSNLSRYDGIHYGHRSHSASGIQNKYHKGNQKINLVELYEYSRAEGFGEEVKRRILLGTYILSSQYYDAFYLKAQKVRRLIYQDFQKIFNSVDILLSPISLDEPLDIGEKSSPEQMYMKDFYTVPVSLAGLCGLSLPIGKHKKNGLPFGVQIIGNHYNEEELFQFSSQLESIIPQMGDC